MQETETKATFCEFAILELMGHVRLAGKVSEQPLFGVNLGRIDIPTREGGWTTQFFGGASVYRLTPCSEEVARAVALHNEPEPVHRWELPAPERTVDSRVAGLAFDAASVDLRDDPDDDDDDDDRF